MFRTNSVLGYGVNYSDMRETSPGKNGKTKWYSTYYDNDDVTLHNVEERLDNNSERNE